MKIPLTPAGRGRVRELASRWVRVGSYPRASPHAEEEEFESSTHARGTRAGTKAGELLGEGGIVPACVLARGGRGILKIPLTPAGRGRVRELASRWVRAESYPRASPHAEEEEFEDSTHARGDAGGYVSWRVTGRCLDRTRVRPRTRRKRNFEDSTHARGDAGGYIPWRTTGCSLLRTRVRPRTRRKRNLKIPLTPAGTRAGTSEIGRAHV